MARQGDIVIVVDLLDPQGRNPKDRPCVLISAPERIATGGPLDVVAITTRLPDPLPFDHVSLRWDRRRHPQTGLTEPNAAVCSWLVEVEASRVIRTVGHVRGKELLQIAAVLQALRGAEEG